jgi:hypothetical protein
MPFMPGDDRRSAIGEPRFADSKRFAKMRATNRKIEISQPNAKRSLPTAARGVPSVRSHREEGKALRAACPR